MACPVRHGPEVAPRTNGIVQNVVNCPPGARLLLSRRAVERVGVEQANLVL